MKAHIQQIVSNATQAVETVADVNQLDQVRTQFLGKKGVLTNLLKQLGLSSPKERVAAGKEMNAAKQFLLVLLEQKANLLRQTVLEQQLINETIDISLPGRSAVSLGSMHPITRLLNQVTDFFTAIGFQSLEGPEIETDYYNFKALNFPLDHPARAMHDTFYFPDGLLLRTHTSTVQIRALETGTLPLRMMAAGRVYRCDSDQTHTPMFHQLEGLVVDEQCTFAELKNLLENFLTSLFEHPLKTRFRPSYFPFTEPSAEVDIACIICNAKGCRVCKHTGWLEVLGCGMVHPTVLTMCNVNAERYTGFAFGLGLDRLAMLRYGVDDLRKFFENDVRFLRQF